MRTCWLPLTATLFFSPFAQAEGNSVRIDYQMPNNGQQSESQVSIEVDETLPLEEQLELLFSKIRQNPKNLDLNYKYAKVAEKLGKFDEALSAYERMLIVTGDIPRVKLDMAMVYAQLKDVNKAETLFQEVLDANPPESVRDNIQRMMSEVGKLRKRHFVNGSLTFGWHADSNANASPASGQQVVGGLDPIPLDPNSLEATDDQVFSALSLKYSYALDPRRGINWNTEGLYYKANYASLGNLNVTLKSIKMGPSFNLPSLKSRFAANVQYSDTNLARVDYQKSVRKAVQWSTQVHPKLMLVLDAHHDWKRHQNSASSSLYTLRDGGAWEFKSTLNYLHSDKDMFSLSFKRHEELTRQDYYDYGSRTLDMKYIRKLPHKLTAIAGVGFSTSEYGTPDPSVDPDIIRKDSERNWSLMLSLPLGQHVTFTGGYTYRDLDSSIQNYEYENERWSFMMTTQF